jgi:hypothetical protein
VSVLGRPIQDKDSVTYKRCRLVADFLSTLDKYSLSWSSIRLAGSLNIAIEHAVTNRTLSSRYLLNPTRYTIDSPNQHNGRTTKPHPSIPMVTNIDQDVPGTVLLVDSAGHHSGGKHASDRSDIVLVPQPSNDPEDPLNWSRKRKMWALFMVFVYTMGVGIPGTLHYSVIADITKDTGIPTADLGAYAMIPTE